MYRIKEGSTDIIEQIENAVIDSFTIKELERRIEKATNLIAQYAREKTRTEQMLIEVRKLFELSETKVEAK